MNTPIEDIFSVFNKAAYKEQTRNALRYSKTVYEKYGKNMANEVAKNKLYYIRYDNGNHVHFTLIQLFIYRVAYYANMKSFKNSWTLDEVRSVGINEIWRRDPWVYKDQHIMKSVDDFTDSDVIKYEYNFNKDRYDFEFKFSKKFDYNILLKSAWYYILNQYCNSNCVGSISHEEREIVYYIISKLTTAYKQNVVDTMTKGSEQDILTLISTVQDDLLLPMEFTIHLLCIMLVQRKLIIFAGDDGTINSYINNGNVRYDITDADTVYSLPIHKDNSESSVVSVSLFSKQLSKSSEWITNILFAGLKNGKILQYNFDNCNWSSSIIASSDVVKIVVVDEKVIVITKTAIEQYSVITDASVASSIPIASLIGGTTITAALYIDSIDTLVLGDDKGNIASVKGFKTSTTTIVPYQSTAGIALDNVNNKLNKSISCIDLISFKNENDLTKMKNVICVGFDNGAVCSYYIETDVWIYVNGTQSKVADSCYVKAYDNGQIFNDKIIRFIMFETNLFIFTESGKMGSFGVYNGGFTSCDGIDILGKPGPGHHGNLSKYGKITSVVTQNTDNSIRFIVSTDTGKVLIYYVYGRSWDYNCKYLQDLLGVNVAIRDTYIYEIPFQENNIFCDIILKRYELCNNVDQPITNRY